MRISPLNSFKLNRTTNSQKTQPRLKSLSTDTISFSAKIPTRDEVYFPNFNSAELKYRELFTEGNELKWSKLGELTSDKGLSLLEKLQKDKSVSDDFKAKVLLGEGDNLSCGRHIQLACRTEGSERKRHLEYALAMINAAPNEWTVADLLATPYEDDFLPLRDVDYTYFSDIIGAVAKKGALSEVIFKPVKDKEISDIPISMFGCLSKLKQEAILSVASPKTKEKIFSNGVMIFGSPKTLTRLLEFAFDYETKLKILTSTTRVHENLLHHTHLAQICLDELDRLEEKHPNKKDELKEVRKQLLLQKNNFENIPIHNPQNDKDRVLTLLDLSPDEETLITQLGNIYYNDARLDGISPSDIIERISTQDQLDVFLNSQVHDYVKPTGKSSKGRYYSLCPVKACLDLDQILAVLDKFDRPKAKLKFLTGSYEYNGAARKVESMSQNINKRLFLNNKPSDIVEYCQVYWNKILEIISNDDVTPDEAIKLLNKYQFIVPQEEEKYFNGIVDSLRQQITESKK